MSQHRCHSFRLASSVKQYNKVQSEGMFIVHGFTTCASRNGIWDRRHGHGLCYLVYTAIHNSSNQCRMNNTNKWYAVGQPVSLAILRGIINSYCPRGYLRKSCQSQFFRNNWTIIVRIMSTVYLMKSRNGLQMWVQFPETIRKQPAISERETDIWPSSYVVFEEKGAKFDYWPNRRADELSIWQICGDIDFV